MASSFSLFETSVVKIFSTRVDRPYGRPWATPIPKDSTGTGFFIKLKDGKIVILTNAHVINNQTFCQIQKPNSDDKYSVKLLVQGSDCDLACLVLNEEKLESDEIKKFWENTSTLKLGSNETIDIQKVRVVGYPQGNSLCITEGGIARTQVSKYPFGQRSLLSMDVTAKSKPGSSGSPVVSDNNEVVGVIHATGSLEAQAIPLPIIKRFLKEISMKNYVYQGIPGISFSYQSMLNPIMRKEYGMDKSQSGIRLKSTPELLSSAYGHLQKDDVLLEIDGQKIDNEGKIRHPHSKTPIEISHAISVHQLYENITFKVLREKTIKEITFPLTRLIWETELYPCYLDDKTLPPQYFYARGVIIQPLSYNFANCYQDIPPLISSSLSKGTKKESEDQESLMIAQIFKNESTQGYEGYCHHEIETINGKRPVNLLAAYSLLYSDNSKDKTCVIKLQNGGEIYLAPTTAKEDEEFLKNSYFQAPPTSLQLLSLFAYQNQIHEDLTEELQSKDEASKVTDLIMQYSST